MIRNLPLLSLLLVFPCFAQTEGPQQPTKASSPLPTMSETQNIDTVLSEKVQKAINDDPALKGQAISAASVNGNITLQGSVDSIDIEEKAMQTAKAVAGVVSVNSQLTVKLINNEPSE